MTINKGQGQTFLRVGIYLPTPCFSHGQLYVAKSRVGQRSALRILIPKTATPASFTQNVVYRELLDNVTPTTHPIRGVTQGGQPRDHPPPPPRPQPRQPPPPPRPQPRQPRPLPPPPPPPTWPPHPLHLLRPTLTPALYTPNTISWLLVPLFGCALDQFLFPHFPAQHPMYMAWLPTLKIVLNLMGYNTWAMIRDVHAIAPYITAQRQDDIMNALMNHQFGPIGFKIWFDIGQHAEMCINQALKQLL